MKKWMSLAVALVLIVSAIVFFESQKTEVSVQESEVINISTQTAYSDARLQRIEEKSQMYPRAIELVSPDGYINTEPFNLSDYVGEKVILLDIWTYSCINCQRTIPYLQQWWKAYEDDGLLIIGVHSPEFAFEEEYDNVVRATEQFGVTWPVIQDNNRQTFRAYGNRYWPRKYLIDIDGFIVYDHIGEGSYDETENKIRELLLERQEVLGESGDIGEEVANTITDPDFSQIRTPEIYFGFFRQDTFLGNPGSHVVNKTIEFTFPNERKEPFYYLQGTWSLHREYIKGLGEIETSFTAKDVYMVLGSESKAQLDVYVDGQLHDTISVTDETIYHIVALDEYGSHDLHLETDDTILAYTFTFG